MIVPENKKALFFGFFCFLVLFFIFLTQWTSLFFAGSTIPIALFIIVLLSFSDIKPVYLFLVFILPFSVKAPLPGSDIQIIIPGELIEAILFFVYIMRYFTGRQKFDVTFFFHPVTICVILYLFFCCVSLLYSTMPAVSIKAMAVKIVYVGVYYFLLYELVKERSSLGPSVFTFYGFAITIIAIYSLYNHAGFEFSKDSSSIVSLPFYADHTIYSACMAFVLPVILLQLFTKQEGSNRFYFKMVLFLVSMIILTGIFFSFCRATWISLISAIGMFILIRIKIKPIQLLAGILLLGTYANVYNEEIKSSFKQNRYDSNARGAGIEEQTKSITNISNDQSNGERINRWKCALRMFEERPFVGFGPGTYQFQYLPFQRQKEMTRISVVNPYHIANGHGGSAHSEYLLLLSESGIFSFLLFLSILIITFALGMKNCIYGKDNQYKNLATALLIGLATYLTHGFFNNFLDTDKAAFLFWGAISLLTTIDIQLRINPILPVLNK